MNKKQKAKEKFVKQLVVKIQALAGYARSCHGGNIEVMDNIKKTETEALALLTELEK